MLKPRQPRPYFRGHTIGELEALRSERLKTEEVTESVIYEAMARLINPNPGLPDALSMPVRIENIAHEHVQSEIARITMRIILLDEDFRPAITRDSTMIDGTWSFESPIYFERAEPMKIGFLLPSPPDDTFEDPSTFVSIDVLEEVFA